MKTFVITVLWLRLALACAGCFSAIIIRREDRRRATAATFLSAVVAVSLLFLALFIRGGSSFPFNQSYDGFFVYTLALSVIILLNLKKLVSRPALFMASALVVAYSAAGMHGAKLEPVVKMSNQIPLATIFVVLRDMAVACFAFLAAVAAVELVRPGTAVEQETRTSDPLYSAALWGFVFFSFCQLFGSMWTATSGWGDIWLWKQSFLFSAIVWIYYAGLLHLRHIPKWPDKAFLALSVFGYLLQLFYLHIYYFLFHIK